MKQLCITRYTIPAALPRPYRIAFLSDLHDQDGSAVLAILQQEQPDLICIGGDLTERHYHCVSTSEDQEEYEAYYLHNVSPMARLLNHTIHVVYEAVHNFLPEQEVPEGNGVAFLRQAVKLAPVCYSTGNHEWFLQEQDREEIRATGAILLENQDCQPLPGLRVGGLPTRNDPVWLERFCAKDGFRLLICHHPEYYSWLMADHPERTADLILSGHAHGGQWRFFGRGVYAPGQGFWPKYTHGLYEGKLLVSSGAARTSRIPRFGNPPEVVLLTLGQNE